MRRPTPPALHRRTPRRETVRLPCIATAMALLITAATGCTRTIEEDPPIPEHRIESCETWCAFMFDPVCPAADVPVPTEEGCIDICTTEDGLWGPVDGIDECAPTRLPYVDCLASLPCDELQQHFALVNMVPAEEQSSCGGLMQAQLDCQTAHY